MNQYEVREHTNPEKQWIFVRANSPAEAISNLIDDARWNIPQGVTELIDVRTVVVAPEVTLALLDNGKVTEVI